MDQQLLKQTVMKRVHRIHALRKVINQFTLKCFILFCVFLGVVSSVSVGSVASNVMSLGDSASIFYYSKYAFMHTELIVQALLLGGIGTTLWLLRDVIAYSLKFNTHAQQIAH